MLIDAECAFVSNVDPIVVHVVFSSPCPSENGDFMTKRKEAFGTLRRHESSGHFATQLEDATRLPNMTVVSDGKEADYK
jgi:hypothetical protein